MRKIKETKGFTLAELLIVVAIIAVLVAVAIPVFTTQLERSRQATDTANVRSAYAECVAEYLTTGQSTQMTVTAQKRTTSWQSGYGTFTGQVDGSEKEFSLNPATVSGGTYTVSIDATGSITVN
jgi:type IV pilus assembly protein PilA